MASINTDKRFSFESRFQRGVTDTLCDVLCDKLYWDKGVATEISEIVCSELRSECFVLGDDKP